MIKVSAVLINYNCDKYLNDSINSVMFQKHKPLEILVIDNASTDNSVSILKEKIEFLKIIFNKENIGFAKAANQGIKQSKGEYILIMNTDIVLAEDFLANIVRNIGKLNTRTGVISGKILRSENTNVIDSTGQFINKFLKPEERGYGTRDHNQFKEGFVFSSCGAVGIYKKDMLEDIKINEEYFDEDFFMYYEDFDLGFRANLYGWRAYYEPEAVAYHHRGGSSIDQGRKFLSKRYEYIKRPVFIRRHILVNRYLVLLKDCPLLIFLLYLPFLIVYEIFFWIYVILFDIRVVFSIINVFKLAKRMFFKRKIIFSNRKTSNKDILQWII